MAKKKSGSRKDSAMDISEFDDDASIGAGSSCTTLTNCGDFETVVDDRFQTALDELFEKRGSTREKAISKILEYLREDVRAEECAENSSTLISRCQAGIRKGSATEAALSAELLGLYILSLEETSEALFRSLQADLTRCAAQGASPEARCAATESLALAAFVAGEDEACTVEVMERLRGMWRKGDAQSRAAAVRGWTLLCSSLSDVSAALGSAAYSGAIEAMLSQLAELLHDKDVEVRGTAGEALALLYRCRGVADVLSAAEEGTGAYDEYADDEGEEEYAGEADVHEEGADEEHRLSPSGEDQQQRAAAAAPAATVPASPGARSAAGSISGSSTAPPASPLGSVVHRMRALATGHHESEATKRSKRDKAALRTTFRGLLATVESGRVAVQKVKLQHGTVLTVDTLEGSIQLNAFRRFLAGGFQAHMQHNPLLHAVFNFQPATERPERMSALEKRYFKSPSSASSKYRTAERKGGRAAKASRHVAHFHEDPF